MKEGRDIILITTTSARPSHKMCQAQSRTQRRVYAFEILVIGLFLRVTYLGLLLAMHA
jgi:hypothetical protein